MSIKAIEAAVLMLVVAHAALHLPHDLTSNWKAVQQMKSRSARWVTKMAAWLVMAAAVFVSLSPFVYYSIECFTRVVGEHLAGA